MQITVFVPKRKPQVSLCSTFLKRCNLRFCFGTRIVILIIRASKVVQTMWKILKKVQLEVFCFGTKIVIFDFQSLKSGANNVELPQEFVAPSRSLGWPKMTSHDQKLGFFSWSCHGNWKFPLSDEICFYDDDILDIWGKTEPNNSLWCGKIL